MNYINPSDTIQYVLQSGIHIKPMRKLNFPTFCFQEVTQYTSHRRNCYTDFRAFELMLTIALGEPYTQGYIHENPIWIIHSHTLFNRHAIAAFKVPSKSPTDLKVFQEWHGNKKYHNTNFKHIN